MSKRNIKQYINNNWHIETPNIIDKLKAEISLDKEIKITKLDYSFRRLSFSLISLVFAIFIFSIMINNWQLRSDKSHYPESVPADNDPKGESDYNRIDNFPVLTAENVKQITIDNIPIDGQKKTNFIESFNQIETFNQSMVTTEFNLDNFRKSATAIIINTSEYDKIEFYLMDDKLVIIHEKNNQVIYNYSNDSDLFTEFLPKK